MEVKKKQNSYVLKIPQITNVKKVGITTPPRKRLLWNILLKVQNVNV